MLSRLKLNTLLFFDIETVSQEKEYSSLTLAVQNFWKHKHQFIEKSHQDYEASYKEKAGIYAEFGKVVCISCGYFKDHKLIIKSFASENEKDLLLEFSQLLSETSYSLCGHNIKEFDVPFICRRMLINHVALPPILDIAGKKPWEVNFVDTLQLWKFGDYKSYTSLNLLAQIFNIPTPKYDIDGSQVGNVFWVENDLDRIVAYCQKDMLCVARLLQRWKNLELIQDQDIQVIA